MRDETAHEWGTRRTNRNAEENQMRWFKWFIGFIIIGVVVICWIGYHVPGSHGPLPVLSPGDVICPDPSAHAAYWEARGRWNVQHGDYLLKSGRIGPNGETGEEKSLAEKTSMEVSAKSTGCVFIPPGTLLASEGNTSNEQIDLGTYDGRFFGADGVEHGKVSLVSYQLETVTAQMPDGGTVKGYGWDNTSKSENGDSNEDREEQQPTAANQSNQQQQSTAVNQPTAAENPSPSVLPVVAPETQQTEPVQQEAEPQQQTEPVQQVAPPRMGRDGTTGGQASDKWQKVQSGGQEIYVKTNSFLVHEGVLYIEGDCVMRQYFFSGSMETPQTPQRIRLIPGSPFEKKFNMLCKVASAQK